jgi:uncharacterized protein YjbI with pentapeptide repeats
LIESLSILTAQILPSRYQLEARNARIYLPKNELLDIPRKEVYRPSKDELKALNLPKNRELFSETAQRLLQESSNNKFPDFINSLCSITESPLVNSRINNPKQDLNLQDIDQSTIFQNNEKTNKTLNFLFLPFEKGLPKNDLRLASRALYFISLVSPQNGLFDNRIGQITDALKNSNDKISNIFLSKLLLTQIPAIDQMHGEKILEALQSQKMLASELSLEITEKFPQISSKFTDKNIPAHIAFEDLIKNREKYRQIAQNELPDCNLTADTKNVFGIEIEANLNDPKQVNNLVISYNDKLTQINKQNTGNLLSLGNDTYGIPEIRTGHGGLALNSENLLTISRFLRDLNSLIGFQSLESNHITMDSNSDNSLFKIKKKSGPEEDEKYKANVLEFNTPKIIHTASSKELPFLIDGIKLKDQIFLLNSLKDTLSKNLNQLSEKEKLFLKNNIKNYFNADTANESFSAHENILLAIANLTKQEKLYAPILRLGGEAALPILSSTGLMKIYTQISDSIEGLNLSKRNLAGISIQTKSIKDSDFSEANLENSKIKAQEIYRSSFMGSNLSGANLETKTLTECNFRETNLSSARIKAETAAYSDFSSSYQNDTQLNFQDQTKIYGLTPPPHKPL